MTITESGWTGYIDRLAAINNTAARKFVAFLNTHETATAEGRKLALDYAAALVQKYGESAAAVACEMYDAVAEASGVLLPAAEPAAVATYGEVAKTVNGIMKQSDNPEYISSGVSRLVKQAGVDTTAKNAIRDGAEWAWVPHGDTCSFCLMLASNGWQKASKKALKGDHAEHVHANCDCTYAIRFDSRMNIAGYDPDALYEQYQSAEGDTWQEKLNSMRRANYAENADKIRAQKREAYAARKARESIAKYSSSGIINTNEMFKKDSDVREDFNFISNKRFNELMIPAKKKGAIILRGTPEVEKHLADRDAASSCIGNVLLFRKDVAISEVLEEIYHFEQNLAGVNDDKGEPLRTILNEIDAKRHLLDNAIKYQIPRNEVEFLQKQLYSYEEQLEDYMKGR